MMFKNRNFLSLISTFRNRSSNRDVTATKAGRLQEPSHEDGWAARVAVSNKGALAHKGLRCEWFRVCAGALLREDSQIQPGGLDRGFILTT